MEVSDNGPGIPDDVAKRLFEPFAHGPKVAGRINSSRSTHEGTGLGLAICRRLIEDARGTISANSRPGYGTTFQILLPTSRQARAKAG
jgi:signal transduction histidine kinase